MQNKVVTNFCKIDTIYITIIALIFVVIIIIIVNVINSGDWSMIIWLLLILSLTLSCVIIYIDLHNYFMFHSSTKYGDSKKKKKKRQINEEEKDRFNWVISKNTISVHIVLQAIKSLLW